MDFEILYWHWIVFGIGLMLLEIVLPSFTALWFGAGAILVGGLLFLFPSMSTTLQVVLWTVFSSLLTWLWFRYLKPLTTHKARTNLSREDVLGEVGQVLSIPNEERHGNLRFPVPVLGFDEWQFISQDDLAIGDRVRVIDVSGNSLIVTKN